MEQTKELTLSQNGVAKRQLPTLNELIEETPSSIRDNALMVLLNQEPPSGWLKTHPMTKNKYLPVERVEYLLSRIFTKWWIEVRSVQVIANSCVVTVRLYVVNPVTRETEWNDGVGACPIQTNQGAGATDFSQVKAAGVQMAAPSAETYAFKDAAEKFGKLFGKDLNRKDEISYTDLLKNSHAITFEDLRDLYELKKDSLNKSEAKDAERILNNKEEKSYYKLHTSLLNK